MANTGRPGIPRKQRLADGLCIDCPAPPLPAESGLRCGPCAIRNREAAKRANLRKRANSKCRTCGEYSGRQDLCVKHRYPPTEAERISALELETERLRRALALLSTAITQANHELSRNDAGAHVADAAATATKVVA